MLPIDIKGKEGRTIAFLLNLPYKYATTPNTPGKRNKKPINFTIKTGICSALNNKSKPTSNEHNERKI